MLNDEWQPQEGPRRSVMGWVYFFLGLAFPFIVAAILALLGATL